MIFDNGTESNLLMRSLQRALHKDEAGRRITDPVAGPLFSGDSEDGDLSSGTVYVLRSKSDDAFVAAHQSCRFCQTLLSDAASAKEVCSFFPIPTDQSVRSATTLAET